MRMTPPKGSASSWGRGFPAYFSRQTKTGNSSQSRACGGSAASAPAWGACQDARSMPATSIAPSTPTTLGRAGDRRTAGSRPARHYDRHRRGMAYSLDPKRFAQRVGTWLQDDGPEPDVVISCRVRLARNVEGYPFVLRLEDDKARELAARAREALVGQRIDGETIWVGMEEAPPIMKLLLRERYLVSRDLAPNDPRLAARPGRGVAFGERERLAVMVNEEDHLRLQSISPGYSLPEAFAGVRDPVRRRARPRPRARAGARLRRRPGARRPHGLSDQRRHGAARLGDDAPACPGPGARRAREGDPRRAAHGARRARHVRRGLARRRRLLPDLEPGHPRLLGGGADRGPGGARALHRRLRAQGAKGALRGAARLARGPRAALLRHAAHGALARDRHRAHAPLQRAPGGPARAARGRGLARAVADRRADPEGARAHAGRRRRRAPGGGHRARQAARRLPAPALRGISFLTPALLSPFAGRVASECEKQSWAHEDRAPWPIPRARAECRERHFFGLSVPQGLGALQELQQDAPEVAAEHLGLDLVGLVGEAQARLHGRHAAARAPARHELEGAVADDPAPRQIDAVHVHRVVEGARVR